MMQTPILLIFCFWTVVAWASFNDHINSDDVPDHTIIYIDESSPLVDACKRNDFKMVRMLVDKGADVRHRDDGGRSCLLYAVRNGNFEMVRYLVAEQFANVNVADDEGRTPISVASANGNLEMVKFLADNGANLEMGQLPEKTSFEVKTLLADLCADVSSIRLNGKRGNSDDEDEDENENETNTGRMKRERRRRLVLPFKASKQ